jgi:hypothetical protein
MPDNTVGDPSQIIANLQCKLEQRTAELSASIAERDAYKAERDEALEQQTAMADVLGVINASPGELTPSSTLFWRRRTIYVALSSEAC